MSVKGQAAREAIDREAGGKELRRQLRSNLASGPRSDGAVLATESAPKVSLPRARRLSADAAISATLAGRDLVTKPFGKRLLIPLDGTGSLALVEPVGEFERVWIFRKGELVPEGSGLQISTLGAAQAMLGQAVKANGLGEAIAKPVSFMESGFVDAAETRCSVRHPVDGKHSVSGAIKDTLEEN